jgi:methionyl-tRNA formyltransferase
VFDAETLRHPDTIQAVRELKADLGLSVKFGYILKPEMFGIFPHGCLNLHTSFLPYNRGANPNVWPIVEGTPAGVTLHRIDAGIDTGPIVSREEVAVSPTDTGQTLYQKLEDAAYTLFVREWPAIQSGRLTFIEQPVAGTFHSVKDYDTLLEINAEKSYRGVDLINILRACTFSPYPGAYLQHEDRKVFMRIELYEG